jgi:hypothetical protein
MFMKALRVVGALASSVFIALLILNAQRISGLAIEDGRLTWMVSSIVPLVIISLLTAALLGLVFPLFTAIGRHKALLVVFVLAITYGGYFLVNRTSVGDWVGTGTDMSPLTGSGPVQLYLNSEHPSFNGVFCFAMPGCSHCEVAIPRLGILKDRNPGMDVMVFVFSTDTAEFEGFKQLSGVTNVTYAMVPDPMASIALCEGSFPTFFYFENGKIVYRWFNNEFGNPALDRVERTFR